MNDERFERELRGFLAERAPVAVSPAFRARLHAVSAEPTIGAGALGGWLGGARRTLVGTATVAVAAAVLVVLLTRPEVGIIRDPSQVGGPSAAPAVPRVPFVIAPSALFSAAAIADADERLGAVFTKSGIEGRLIVQDEASAAALTTPAGWPDHYDADGNDELDVAAVFGLTSDGTITCCLTITGDLIDRARDEGYWRTASWPDRLKADMESDDPAIRDESLDRFVRGIEALEPGIPFTREAIARESIMRQFAILVGLGLLAAVVFVRRSRWSVGRTRLATPVGSPDLTPDVVPVGAGAPGGDTMDSDALPPTIVSPADAAPVTWARTSGGLPRDRTLMAIAGAALASLLAPAIWDLVRPTPAGIPLEVTASSVGLASPALPLVPLALLATAVLALLVVAGNGGKARRLAIVGLLALVGLGGWWAFDGSRPAADRDQRSWVAGLGAGPVERGSAGLFDFQTYPLEPGEPFTLGMTVTNPGPLPMTILGLDGVQSTEPNAYIASVVGLAAVHQPTDDGTVQSLSARPEDAIVKWPITLSPGDDLAIVLLGRAGPCADPAGTGHMLPIMWLQLTYRVLGIERSEPVGLPPTVWVPSKATCTVETPAGTVTFSEP